MDHSWPRVIAHSHPAKRLLALDTTIEDLRGCSDGADWQRDTRRLAAQGAWLGGQDFLNVKTRPTTPCLAVSVRIPLINRVARGTRHRLLHGRMHPSCAGRLTAHPCRSLPPKDLRHDAIVVPSFPSRRSYFILGILAKIEDARQADSFRPPGVRKCGG